MKRARLKQSKIAAPRHFYQKLVLNEGVTAGRRHLDKGLLPDRETCLIPLANKHIGVGCVRRNELVEWSNGREWAAIESKLNEIANMKQSVLGYVWEFITYGQGSLQEKQAMAMMMLASELGDKFGYANERTWEEMLRGNLGHFGRKQ